MKVSVYGLGYIGLPTAAVLASHGVNVVGVDVDQNVVDTINQGKIHIVEPELDALVHKMVKEKVLKAVSEPEESDVFLITVPTPFKNDHEPNLSYIEDAAKMIAPVLEKGNLVILESTSPVGTTDQMVQWMKSIRSDLVFPELSEKTQHFDITVAYCPERVLPGNVIRELVENDRVIGGVNKACSEEVARFYKIFVKGNCLTTNARTAELSKLVENSFRDVNIAFANELSLVCDKLEINVWELIQLANHHPRVNILKPGPGVGGHCIAVDPWFIVDSAPEEAKLIHTARTVNDSKPNFVLEKIRRAINDIGKSRSELSIACLGLSFKPDIDDLRESPALEIAQHINTMGFKKQYLVEPNIKEMPNSFGANCAELALLEEAISESDIVVILVNHRSFKKIDKKTFYGKKIIDTCGFLN